jgi:hypothetical protein
MFIMMGVLVIHWIFTIVIFFMPWLDIFHASKQTKQANSCRLVLWKNDINKITWRFMNLFANVDDEVEVGR